MLEVYKFGGASVKDADSFRNVAEIITKSAADKLVVIVSALGKTTNELEALLDAFYEDKASLAQEKLAEITSKHLQIAGDLMPNNTQILAEINDLFVELDWILEDEKHPDYDYSYDQVVSIGELCSTKILSAYLQSLKKASIWLDVRDVLKTNNTHREAKVDWNISKKLINDKTRSLFDSKDIVVSQGFLGCTSENFTTTLGREGSDFSAAIFTYCLDAESMTIWKDVKGILTGDPRKLENVIKMDRISYREAIEMTYYGAKVIHPKTIKPLQNKSIPLFVKSFINPKEDGTRISDDPELSYPPIVVLEENQCLIHIATKDFSFVAEEHLSKIFDLMDNYRIKVNLMKNSAISFSVCTTYKERRVNKFVKELSDTFKVIVDKELELLTIRHFTDPVVEQMCVNRTIMMEERLADTIQLIVKTTPVIKPKA